MGYLCGEVGQTAVRRTSAKVQVYAGLISESGRSPGEGNGNPLQFSCLDNSRDRGAWWAAIYGVSQSRTRLKQLSGTQWSEVVLGALTTLHLQVAHV